MGTAASTPWIAKTTSVGVIAAETACPGHGTLCAKRRTEGGRDEDQHECDRVEHRDRAPVRQRAALEQLFHGGEPGDDDRGHGGEEAVEGERGDACGVEDGGEKNERYRQEAHAASRV